MNVTQLCPEKARITQEMKAWLNSRPRTMLTVDLVLQFIALFQLEARQAGRLLAQWARTLP